MKRLYIIILAFAMFGCQDYLDETSKGKLIPKTVSDMFDMMSDFVGDNYGGGASNGFCRGTSFSVFLTDDILPHADMQNTFMVSKKNAYMFNDIIYGAGESDYQWNKLYHAIYLCNWIIQNVDGAELGNNPGIKRENIKAMAKANRAFNYFMLVNDYAPFYNAATSDKDLAIPMPVEAAVETSLPQSSVKEVYDLMIEDLTTSLASLNPTEPHTFLPSRIGAYCLLSKIYMHMNDYNNMLKYAKEALKINDQLFDYNNIYAGPMYDFFLVGYGTAMKSWTIPGQIWFREYGGTGVYYTLADDLLALFNKEKDLRYKYFTTNKSAKTWMPTDQIRNTMTHEFSQSMRMSEVYLLAAEASVRATEGKSLENARQYLNEVRKHRMQMPEDITETDEDLLLQEILDERRREFRATSMRWYDIKRLGISVTHHIEGGTYTYDPSVKEYYFPIPPTTVEANPFID